MKTLSWDQFLMLERIKQRRVEDEAVHLNTSNKYGYLSWGRGKKLVEGKE